MTNNDDVAGICERLRQTRSVWSEAKGANIKMRRNPDGHVAVTLIERQAAQIERLREVLEELIDHAEQCMGRLDYHDLLMMGDEPIKEARAALKGED